MELKELAQQIAEAVTYGHEHSRQKNAEQQDRWFETDEKTGLRTLRRETHDDGFGVQANFATIAFENIHDLGVTGVEIQLDIPDMELEKDKKGVSKLICSLFSDDNKKNKKRNKNTITVKTEKIDPPPGLKILQRMATREVLEHYNANHPNLAKIILAEELGEQHDSTETSESQQEETS